MSGTHLKSTSCKHLPKVIIDELLNTFDEEYNLLYDDSYCYKYQHHGKLFIFFDYINEEVKHALALHSNDVDIHHESLSVMYVLGDPELIRKTRFATNEFKKLFISGYSTLICIDVMTGYVVVRKQKVNADNIKSSHIGFIEECIDKEQY